MELVKSGTYVWGGGKGAGAGGAKQGEAGAVCFGGGARQGEAEEGERRAGWARVVVVGQKQGEEGAGGKAGQGRGDAKSAGATWQVSQY
jgi:hypothetical protein